MYVDGRLVAQNHSLSELEVTAGLGIQARVISLPDGDDLDEFGNMCPDDWDEILRHHDSYTVGPGDV